MREDIESATLEDVEQMNAREFRIWTFMRFNGIENHMSSHDRRLAKIENMLWGLALLIVGSALVAIFT